MSGALATEALRIAQLAYDRAGITDALPTIRIRPVKCGRYSEKTKTVTLPLWLFSVDRIAAPGYIEYYVAHELAHHVGGLGHGLTFQTALKALAGPLWHWETTYKPRQYAKALAILGEPS